MSNTPMTDLYLGGTWGQQFAAGLWAEVYHGYEYHSSRYPDRLACGSPKSDNNYHSHCRRDYCYDHVSGSVTAYKEEDISSVRRPCKLCLAALRKAKEGADNAKAEDAND